MKKARVIAWLVFAIGVCAFMVGFSGATADAKPKMPSYPRISAELQPALSNPIAAIQMPFLFSTNQLPGKDRSNFSS